MILKTNINILHEELGERGEVIVDTDQFKEGNDSFQPLPHSSVRPWLECLPIYLISSRAKRGIILKMKDAGPQTIRKVISRLTDSQGL